MFPVPASVLVCIDHTLLTFGADRKERGLWDEIAQSVSLAEQQSEAPSELIWWNVYSECFRIDCHQ